MRKEKAKKEPYVIIERWEYNSPAFQVLSGDEFKIYFEMRSLYNGRNNGEIVYSSRQAGDCIGKNHRTGARAINNLSKLGFIKVKKDYGYSQKRLAREYELTAISLVPAKKDNRLPKGARDFMRLNDIQAKAIKDVKTSKKSAAKKTKHSPIGVRHSPTHDPRPDNVIRLEVK